MKLIWYDGDRGRDGRGASGVGTTGVVASGVEEEEGRVASVVELKTGVWFVCVAVVTEEVGGLE